MPCQLACPLLVLALSCSLAGVSAGAPLEAASAPEDSLALGADDECVQRGAAERESCGLNALQRHGRRLADERLVEGGAVEGAATHRGGIARGAADAAAGPGGEEPDEDEAGEEEMEEQEEEPEEEKLEGGADHAAPIANTTGQNGTASAEQPTGAPKPTKPPKVGPWQQCGGRSYKGPSECMDGYTCWPQSDYYYQCKPSDQAKKTWETYTGSTALNVSSSAPLLTFYMYRAQGPNDYPVKNVNTGTLGGLMWYVHNEVVSCAYGDCEYVRRFGINRIVRYKVQTRAPQPLYDAGMNFGIRYAYDHGQCTGPWKCETQFEKYGYFVGCNNLSSGFPFPDWPVYYSGAWYSLPGPCSARKWEEQSVLCQIDQPGGYCQGAPTGTGTCTYSIVEAGQITIDELENIDSYRAFKEDGGQEYNKTLDEGVNMTFWNNINDTAKNAERVHKADLLFKQKYPSMASDEEMPAPECDFDKPLFFPDGLPTELNENTREAQHAQLGKTSGER